MTTAALARVGGLWGTGLLDVSSDLSVLDRSGRWAVAIPYDGTPVLARFATWDVAAQNEVGPWRGPDPSRWRSSMTQHQYVAAVERTRTEIAAGSVYQANVCRVLSAELPDPRAADVAGLDALLRVGNPAPYGGFLRLPDHGVSIASASPELFLETAPTQHGVRVRTGPIKGTGRVAADLSDKDAAENVMIVDLMRNDLSRVSAVGSVTVTDLLRVEEHPGLVHLVSYVQSTLRADVRWPGLLEAAFPPGSVTGAPKMAAVRLLTQLEPTSRSFYCGAFGWVDADTGEAVLAVAIRTFWLTGDTVNFGTGAGITWGSDAQGEWRETELKAENLIRVAAAAWQGGAP